MDLSHHLHKLLGLDLNESSKKRRTRKKKRILTRWEEESQSKEGRGVQEPKSCLSSFQFLSVTETVSGSTCWHTHKHGHAHGYLDETDFTFNLIKSEREFSPGFQRRGENEKNKNYDDKSLIVIYNYTTMNEMSASIFQTAF